MSDATKDPAAPALASYSLWLIPSQPEQAERFQNLINELASMELASPTFSPHITLISPIPLSMKLRDIQTKIREAVVATLPRPGQDDSPSDSSSSSGSGSGLIVKLQAAQKGDKYYQSVLAPVELPNERLSKLRKELENQFGLGNLPEYFPHLSLFYGGVSSSRRDELANIANTKLAEFDNSGKGLKVDIEEIVIVSCVGTAEQWKVVGTEKLA
ncbi:uncharacterized protein IL334_002300 [Kwoniella shivajii]|uniref:2',3'-cyclic-nucleotide 3'-phosphodiesterase n=1 Tax=Kwoniella shivajii TaxID=564305 RepID=A0ABZ1CVH4_9TREE|nr:hypothetical protein IL334_002300 [Kwoniella shivajii]